MRRLQFWFEFASTYSYVAASRVERVAGAAGVTRVVEILRHEFELTMMLMGRPTLASIDKTVLW